jgi:hypothetical protein
MKEASGSLGARAIVEKVIPRSKKFDEMPKQLTDDVIARLIDEELAFTPSSNPYEAAHQLRNAGERVVVLPLEHRIDRDKGNKIIKKVSPRHYLHLDSPNVIQDALVLARDHAEIEGTPWELPDGKSIADITRMSDKVAQAGGLYPYYQIKAATAQKRTDPPVGMYWVPGDGRPRVITWSRSIKGHELFSQYTQGNFEMELDKEFYGKTMKVTVPSQTKKDKIYDYWILHIPAFGAKDKRQHSEWRKLDVNDRIPDAGYRGQAHQQREAKSVFFTAYAICGYDESARRMRETHELGDGVEIRVNPFPFLTSEGKELLRILREQTIVGRQGLNMTEMDRLIGADTVNRSYDRNFANWTGRFG